MEISKNLKSDLPPTLWGKVLGATPIVMTVIATVLAGLASSEMTRAQYDRSLAAQLQSKASDQWNLYQAKKLQGIVQGDVLDLMEAGQPLHGVDLPALRRVLPDAAPAPSDSTDSPEATRLRQILAEPGTPPALDLFQQNALPPVAPAVPLDPKITAAMAAVQAGRDEDEVAGLLQGVTPAELAAALRAATARSQALDAATGPVNQVVARTEAGVKALLRRLRSDAGANPDLQAQVTTLSRDFAAQRLRYTITRYQAEARINSDIANVYELQLRQSNLAAERHHRRSQYFFIGMLAAQMAVVIATFALAARQRSLLWSLAAAAGFGAASFAFYIYLFT
jgi:hypothetical protein